MMFVKDVAKILKTFRMKSRNKLEKYFSFILQLLRFNFREDRSTPRFAREKIAKGDKLFSETQVMVHVNNRNSIVRE